MKCEECPFYWGEHKNSGMCRATGLYVSEPHAERIPGFPCQVSEAYNALKEHINKLEHVPTDDARIEIHCKLVEKMKADPHWEETGKKEKR